MPDIGPLIAATRVRPDPTLPPRDQLPTMYDLPSEEPGEPGLPDLFHYYQAQLLRETFQPPAVPDHQLFIAQDVNLYYDAHHPRWYKRPDWYAVIGQSPHYADGALRRSYVIWQELVVPTIVAEFLSPGTEDEDLGHTVRAATEAPPTKWEVYEQILGVPYYVLYGMEDTRPQVYRLVNGEYQELSFGPGPLWMHDVGLGLVLWHGRFDQTTRNWLRWVDRDGRLIPTKDERAQAERERAQAERERAQAERERAQAEWERAQAEWERAQAEWERAQAEREHAQAERQRAQAERERAEAAERRIAELEAQLRSLSGPGDGAAGA